MIHSSDIIKQMIFESLELIFIFNLYL